VPLCAFESHFNLSGVCYYSHTHLESSGRRGSFARIVIQTCAGISRYFSTRQTRMKSVPFMLSVLVAGVVPIAVANSDAAMPMLRVVTCPRFELTLNLSNPSLSSYINCNFMACAGEVITASDCIPNVADGTCSGSTSFELIDLSMFQKVATSAQTCGTCSMLSYAVPEVSITLDNCGYYALQQSCYIPFPEMKSLRADVFRSTHEQTSKMTSSLCSGVSVITIREPTASIPTPPHHPMSMPMVSTKPGIPKGPGRPKAFAGGPGGGAGGPAGPGGGAAGPGGGPAGPGGGPAGPGGGPGGGPAGPGGPGGPGGGPGGGPAGPGGPGGPGGGPGGGPAGPGGGPAGPGGGPAGPGGGAGGPGGPKAFARAEILPPGGAWPKLKPGPKLKPEPKPPVAAQSKLVA
jgi:hypothetical protein